MFSDVRCHVKTTQMDAIDMAPISDTSMIVVAKNESQLVLLICLQLMAHLLQRLRW